LFTGIFDRGLLGFPWFSGVSGLGIVHEIEFWK
jgi:hypothetical protein